MYIHFSKNQQRARLRLPAVSRSVDACLPSGRARESALREHAQTATAKDAVVEHIL